MNSEVAAALARFFEDGRGPSHDELTNLFGRCGLTRFDPRAQDPSGNVGKLKRVRVGLTDAADREPKASSDFTKGLIALLRARGCFAANSDQFAGVGNVEALRAALDSAGWHLSSSGELLPAFPLGSLEGKELSIALTSYVRRIQQGMDDAALTVGTAKDLLEAAARHVLVESNGTYDTRMDFPTTVFRAATVRGLGSPTGHMLDDLDRDPQRALEQALILAALAVNRLRRDEGTGHGRPHPSKASVQQGKVAAQCAALVTSILLPGLAN